MNGLGEVGWGRLIDRPRVPGTFDRPRHRDRDRDRQLAPARPSGGDGWDDDHLDLGCRRDDHLGWEIHLDRDRMVPRRVEVVAGPMEERWDSGG